MSAQQNHTRTYVLDGVCPILVGSVLWAISYLLRKYVASTMGVFTITFLASTAGALFISALYRRHLYDAYAFFKKEWRMVLPMSFLSMTVGTSLFTYGLQNVDLGLATILEKVQPLVTVVLAHIFLHEKFSPLSIGLIIIGVLASAGLVPISGDFSLDTHHIEMLRGCAAVVAAAVLWGISGIIGKKVMSQNVSSAHVAFIRCLVGSVTALPLMIIFDASRILQAPVNWHSVGLACLIGMIGPALGYITYFHGLKIVSAGIAGMLELVTPVVCVGLGIVFLDEHFTVLQTVCASVLLLSVSLLACFEAKRHCETMLNREG